VLALMFLAALLVILRGRRDLRRARAEAHHDVVTGLPNRAAAEETLARLIAQAARRRTSLGVVMVDLDRFKAINDEHGHAVGDLVLNEVGAVARQTVRTGDFVGRWGGEELMLLLPDTHTAGAVAVAEKLRHALKNHRIDVIGQSVTASFGVTATTGDREALSGLVAAADLALYEAKANGRDRTEVAAGQHPRELVAC
jgi:diguanylate cyclase (GGDEF)-like protein